MSFVEINAERLLGQTSSRVEKFLHRGDAGTSEVAKRAAAVIESNPLTPDLNGVRISRLEKWLSSGDVAKKINLLTRYLATSIQVYKTSEKEIELSQAHFGVPGHDIENVVHATVAALRMVDQGDQDLGDYAKWEILTSSVNENLGRLMEGDDFTHQVTGLLLARQAIRDFESEGLNYSFSDQKSAKLVAARVMGSIYNHGGKNSGDPIADLVRQSNRQQMCSPFYLRRSLEYDVAQVDQAISSPFDKVRRTNISHTVATNLDSKREPTSLDWGEFYLRNLFPSTTEANTKNPKVYKEIMAENQKIADNRRSNAVTYLLIMSSGESTKLGKQIFAPELDLVTETHWSKKKLPDEIFNKGLEHYKAFVENVPNFLGLKGRTNRESVKTMLAAMSSFLPDDLMDKVYAKYDKLSKPKQKRLVLALKFELQQYYVELDHELAMLKRLVNSGNQHIAMTAKFALEYLEKKKRLDK